MRRVLAIVVIVVLAIGLGLLGEALRPADGMSEQAICQSMPWGTYCCPSKPGQPCPYTRPPADPPFGCLPPYNWCNELPEPDPPPAPGGIICIERTSNYLLCYENPPV